VTPDRPFAKLAPGEETILLMLTALFVAARIVANPVSNVFQKQLAGRSADPVFIIGATHALLTVAVLPLLLLPATWAVGAGFGANMMLCALLAVAGNVLLVHALKSTDLSVLGPVNAYKAVLSLVLGIFVVGEVPTVAGLAGVLLILAGSTLVVDESAGPRRSGAFVRFFRARGIRLRLAALGLSATEAVFLKKALLLSSPLTAFVWWSILGLPVAAAAVLLLPGVEAGGEIRRMRLHGRRYLGLAGATGLMQFTTLLTFGRLPVGYSLALFQLSTLLSLFLGYRFFQEGNLRKRLLGTLVMVAGAVLIALLGSHRA
jgi:drug/metabolite transporter (DMT)-like permease